MFLLGLRNQNQKRVPKTRQEGLSILLSLLTLLAPKGALYAMPGAPLPVRRKNRSFLRSLLSPRQRATMVAPNHYNMTQSNSEQLRVTHALHITPTTNKHKGLEKWKYCLDLTTKSA